MILKKNNKKNDGNPASYSPISLLSNFGKIYERAITNRMIATSTENSWLSPCSLASVVGKVLLMQLIVLLPRRRKIYKKSSQPFHTELKSLREFLNTKWFEKFKNSVNT